MFDLRASQGVWTTRLRRIMDKLDMAERLNSYSVAHIPIYSTDADSKQPLKNIFQDGVRSYLRGLRRQPTRSDG
jgi:hypothetical protein